MPSSMLVVDEAFLVPDDSEHSGLSHITGMTPRNIAMARRLIFWYLLTLQNSVMQTVRSAKAPWRTMAAKCSLLSLVTISKAELAMRSVRTFDAAEKTPNIVRQPERIFSTRAWIICWRHCKTWNVKSVNRHLFSEEPLLIPCLWSQGFGCESWYVRRASGNPSGTWSSAIPPFPKIA